VKEMLSMNDDASETAPSRLAFLFVSGCSFRGHSNDCEFVIATSLLPKCDVKLVLVVSETAGRHVNVFLHGGSTPMYMYMYTLSAKCSICKLCRVHSS
jgi:hypothetical protein